MTKENASTSPPPSQLTLARMEAICGEKAINWLQTPISSNFDRLLSWESCYLFFKSHHQVLSDPKHPRYEEVLEAAQYQLGFYLASFGMYRNIYLLSSNAAIYRELIECLFKKPEVACFYTNGADFIASQGLVFDLADIISKYFSRIFEECRDIEGNALLVGKVGHGQGRVARVSNTLVTKVLMGIFAACPAFDINFKRGVSGFPADLTSLWNRKAYDRIEGFLKAPGVQEFFRKYRPVFTADQAFGKPYPIMRCVDLLFFRLGILADKKNQN